MGSVVSDMLEVAMASLNCFVCIPPKTWDVAAALAILREAGMVSNLPKLNLAELAKNRHIIWTYRERSSYHCESGISGKIKIQRYYPGNEGFKEDLNRLELG